MLSVGEKFPEFRANACVGASKDSLTTIDNETFEGQWVVYFFYPKDFTFVCPTEIAEFNKRLGDFQDRDAMVVGGSTDNEFSHLAWCQSHDDLRGLKYPLVAAQTLARDLGILHPDEGVCLRATYIVDPEGTIQFAAANGLDVGRSVDEVIRVLDALQSGELCPCNWRKGEETLKV
ncbi:peroxiredoxin [Tautonia plasticadhaerens]|uniref:Alkyl hydroperoxide reductase C n=1 Tax=Tautonia plasticadhaerens TaxID=2527974 RepID=A0A518HDI4_9BACT|nr:peroxiredoxin [Tautonia plasticadhaerens]QDV38919.1 Alkyl hydroperoxide reductase subunit C [Tautonia plasticadhaerens]